MKRNKKRSSILKRTSMSNSESSSPAISETGQQNGTKTSKRISFSKRLSVKEFASGDDCITIWNNSYEQSADNCNTVSITNDKHTESNIIGDKIESHDLPILTGPNKENIILHNDLQISVTDSSMSATIRMDNSTVINQYFYKSPGKLNDKETIQNASMDLEDLKPYMYVDQSSFKTQLENSSSSCNMNLKTEQENESSDSEMSMEFFSGELAKNRSGQPFSKHKTLVFEKEELDITHTTTDIIVPKEKEIKNSEIDSTKAMKRNRRQTKIEINDMEISTTPIAPAKRDRRETVYDDPSVDLTLINNPKTLNQSHKSIGGNIKQDISKMFIDYTLTEDKKINKHIHNEKVPTVRCRQTIYFNNECILNDQPNNQKSISNKTANIIPTSEVEDMDETLVLPVNKCDNKSVEKELVFETCKNIQESHGDSTLFLAQTMQTSNFLIQEHVQENKGLKDIDDAINHCKINRKTKYFENDQMTIEPKIVLSSKSQYDTSPINVIDTKSQQNSKSNRQTIHKYQPMNETLVGQMEFNLNTDSESKAINTSHEEVHRMSLGMDKKSNRQTIYKNQPMNETLVGQKEFNLNTDSESKATNNPHEEVHRMSLEKDTKSQQNSKTKRQTIHKNQPINETLVHQMEFNFNTDLERRAKNTSNEDFHRMSLEIDTKSQQNSKSNRQTIYKNQPMNETLVGQKEFNLNTDSESKATNTSHEEVHIMSLEMDTKSQQNSKSNRRTIYKNQPMNETLVGQKEFNLNTDSESKATNTSHEEVHIMSLEMDTKSQQNSKTKRQTIHKYQPMNETLVGQMEFNLNTDSESKAINTSHEEVHRMSLEMDTKSNRQTIYKNQPMIETLVGQKEFNLNTDSESKATNTPHEEVHRMSLEKDTKSQQNSKTKRQTIHKNQPMNETLVHQMEFNFNTDLERKATKIHHADEQKTAVDALRIELQTLNVSPQHNIAKNNRRATIIFKEDNEQSSDIDLTLQNISPKKVCEDIDESKIHEIKMPQCSSKIPKPIFKPTLGATSIILQNELNVSNTQNRTIYEKSMHVEQIENPKNLNINDKLDVLESKNTITDLEESQNKKTKSSKSDLRQTIFFKNTNITSDASFVSDTTTNKRSKNSMCTEELYSKYEEIPNVMDKTYTGMDNLSYKRFNNLNNTMQNNESLDKISDVNLTLNDTQKSSIDPITACSYANITMVNSTCSKTPELFNAFKLENTNNQSSRKSFTMSESTIAESSFLISSLDGLSPNVSARRSLCNEIYEQIRLKVLKATTTNTCPCKCSQESQSINLNTTSTLPDWLKTNKRTYCGKSVAEMEKDFDVQLAKLDTDQNTSYLKPETPSVRFLLENLREGLKQELEQIPEESRCPAPYPSNKPYYYLLKNKLHSENLPWALVNIITAPGGIIQLRNEKLKSVLLTIKIEPNSFKDNGLYLYSSIKFLPNSSHPVSSPFAAVLFEKFSTACPSESSLLYMCSNSNQLFEFLAKIDHKITEICTNTVQLFSILSEYGCTPFIEDSQLMAKKAVVNHSMMQVFRFYLNLTDVNNFQPSDIAIIPECTEVKEKLSKCLIRGIELLEYFLKNIEIIL
uniref:CSON009478 protein n=1 Tax=Culicoides sonorensis TaxID=179676 RepID=A0A336KJ99_CULSO